MRRARAGVQGVRAVRAGACRVCRMGGHGIRAGKACGVGAASANGLDGSGPASPSTSARFLLLFLKKKSPAGIRRIKRCGIICENSSGSGSPIAFPHPWRPIPFALSTVRNGHAALPQERLPSAPLLTGLPPRCIAQARNLRRGRRAVSPRLRAGCASAPPLCQRSLLVNALSRVVRMRKPLEFTTPKRPLLKGGGSALALTGDCLAADVARHIIQRLRPFIPPRRSWPRRPKNRSPCSAPPRRNTWQARSRRWCGSGARPACPDQSKRRI